MMTIPLKIIIFIIASLCALCGLIVLALNHPEWLNPYIIKAFINRTGISGPFLFIGISIICTWLFVPALPLCIAGGLIFGVWYGTLYNLVGVLIGSSGAFLFARYLGANWVKQHSGQKLQAIMRGVEQSGWQFVAILRLLPVTPFGILNYAFGLTPLRLSHFALASLIFTLPSCLTYTYLGYLGNQMHSQNTHLLQTVLIGFSLLVAILFMPQCFKKFKQQLSI